ncbi:hypothetical protein [Piscibacillus salipiscarius]|uniref:Uncharacterized protein n=1 Tax=Piscibacillus salipiscarius TaxID=299480 RepID=A0ABW5QEF3_9BACI
MVKILFWILLILGAFTLNLLGMMNLVPKVITIPLLFLILFLFFYTIFQKNSVKKY